MKEWPENLPPLQPWNEEKHALLNRIKRLEKSVEELINAGNRLAIFTPPTSDRIRQWKRATQR